MITFTTSRKKGVVHLFICLIAIGLFSSCKKEDEKSVIDFGPNGGITERNATGQLTGTVDASDWTHDENWTIQEQALFGPLFNAFPQGGTSGTYTNWSMYDNHSISLFANPFANQATFAYTLSKAAVRSVVVVDKNFTVVVPQTNTSAPTGPHQISLNFTQANLKAGETYRLYYVMHDSTTLLFRGHGDFRINR